jgi:KDO2-lipid IV(A) lauroyltransferase
LLPPIVRDALSRPLALLVWHGSTRLRSVAQTNVALCYPQLSAQERQDMAKSSIRHYARNALEVGMCWFWSPTRFARQFEPRQGEEYLQAAQQAPQGTLFLAPHFGAWEALGLDLSEHLTATLFKPGKVEAINELLVDRRGRFGAQLVPANRRGLKALMDVLREGKGIGLLPDQEPRLGDGRFAPFFGVPALTGVLVPRLIQRTGAKVYFIACVRLPKQRFQVHVLPAEEDIYSTDMDTALAAVNRGVEACIALAPEQYLWAYKRFRARPEGEPSRYS